MIAANLQRRWKFYLHVLISRRSMQVLQVTSQHHLNIHRQLTFSRATLYSWPRLQHSRSQPSIVGDDALHSRPTVPSEPVLALNRQKSIESSV